MDKFLLILEV